MRFSLWSYVFGSLIFLSVFHLVFAEATPQAREQPERAEELQETIPATESQVERSLTDASPSLTSSLGRMDSMTSDDNKPSPVASSSPEDVFCLKNISFPHVLCCLCFYDDNDLLGAWMPCQEMGVHARSQKYVGGFRKPSLSSVSQKV